MNYGTNHLVCQKLNKTFRILLRKSILLYSFLLFPLRLDELSKLSQSIDFLLMFSSDQISLIICNHLRLSVVWAALLWICNDFSMCLMLYTYSVNVLSLLLNFITNPYVLITYFVYNTIYDTMDF